jgi:hypothetical protein
VSRAEASVSGSFAYPAFLHGLGPSPVRTFEGFPPQPPLVAEAARRRPSNDLILSFRALRRTLEPPCVGSSSRGIGVPAADVPPARPLRGAEAPVGPALQGAGSCSALVVSHHLDGFLRVGVAGLLHPATGQGFTAFRACRQGGAPEGGLDAGDSPRGAFRTLRRVSLVSSRTRITAAVAFLSLPSCPAGGSGRSRGPPTAIPADAGGVPPWSRPGDRGGVGAPKSSEGRGPGDDQPGFRRAWSVTSSAPRRLGARVAGAPKSRGDRVPRGVRRSEEGRAWLGDAGALPCRERARRLRGADGSGPGWEAGGRGSEELRHRIPARGRNSGLGGSGGTGTERRGSEEPRRRCPG